MTEIDDFFKRHMQSSNVSIVEFAESTDYCGKPLFPLQRVLLKLIFLEEMEGWEEDLLSWLIKGGRHSETLISPDIRKRRDLCRERGYDHFSEIIEVGGRRSSKGYMTGLAGAYKLWKVHQLDNPGRFFSMDPSKVIDFTCVAASFDQAKTRQFADLRSSIIGCAALHPYISKDLEEILTIRTDSDADTVAQMRSQGQKVSRDYARLRVSPVAANADTVRGMACIFLVLDEMAFFLPGESRQTATAVYGAIEPSLAQFGHHALVFGNSSPYTRIGQFYDQYELAMLPEYDAESWYWRNFAIEFPSWALFDKWWMDPQRRFSHPIMVSPDWLDKLEPEIDESALDTFALDVREKEVLKEKASPDTYKVEYRAQWAEVLDAYLDPVKVDAAYGFLPDGRPLHATIGGEYRYEYRAHCDPSSTTAGFGFAIAHVEQYPDPTGAFPDGLARHVVFDQVKRWNPADFPGHTINYLEVRRQLRNYLQVYSPTELTFDQFNSTGLIQELREDSRDLGRPCRIHEVKATAAINWNRWEAFKTALYLGLVHIPNDCLDPYTDFNNSEYSKQELKFLQEKATGQSKRVDKQDLGPIQTKDIADCIAEVVVKFLGSYLGDWMSKNLTGARMSTGAEGGYQIGGRSQDGPMPGGQRGMSGVENFYSQQGTAGVGRSRGISRDPRRR